MHCQRQNRYVPKRRKHRMRMGSLSARQRIAVGIQGAISLQISLSECLQGLCKLQSNELFQHVDCMGSEWRQMSTPHCNVF